LIVLHDAGITYATGVNDSNQKLTDVVYISYERFQESLKGFIICSSNLKRTF